MSRSTFDQLCAGELAGTRHLKLACGLTRFPPEILSLADTLEVLDLSGNALSSLPDELAQFHRLRIIFCSDNQFTELPEVLGRCPALTMVGFKANRIRTVSAQSLPAKLRWLILTDNEIEALPTEIGERPDLQKVMLAGNRLRALPASMAQCQRIELLRIAANQLTELPAWLLSLPRLSWLAYSGNPFVAKLEAQVRGDDLIDDISWDDLDVQQLLGQGASGYIHHAQWHRPEDDNRAVAVKLFKGAVTSDGLPQCEMAAAIHAGYHPNLTEVLGRIKGHPDGVNGLVMGLIDARFKNLAGPPSFESCTRDVYAADTRFELPELLTIALGVASAAQHLHQCGIMHGDLYGHNILHAEGGQALFGDFGAASFYVPDQGEVALGLQRLEVRAFGCLLEELLERCVATAAHSVIVAQLKVLDSACLTAQADHRPLFAEIAMQLRQTIEASDSCA